jgi:methionyl-tRNA formyltransferase
MRVVFMGTPGFALPALSRLADSEYEVVAVYTQPDEPVGRGRRMVPTAVKSAALARALTVNQPPSLKEAGEVAKLAGLRPDTIVVAAYGQLLPQSVLDVPRFGCVNIHPSLLPRHRGPSPVAAAILAGDEATGVSIMLMDKGMDTGPVLAQSQWAISDSDTTGTLTDRLAEAGANLLMETLPLWVAGRITPQAQDNGKATYCRVVSKEDGRMDWHLPAPELWRRVRAFQPWPGCYTVWQGKLLKIVEAVPLPGEGEEGRVVEIRGVSGVPVGVQTASGTLGLLKVQLEGKRVVSAEEFIRGQRGFVGSLLPG